MVDVYGVDWARVGAVYGLVTVYTGKVGDNEVEEARECEVGRILEGCWENNYILDGRLTRCNTIGNMRNELERRRKQNPNTTIMMLAMTITMILRCIHPHRRLSYVSTVLVQPD